MDFGRRATHGGVGALALASTMCGLGASAQATHSHEWVRVAEATDGSTAYMQSKAIGAAHLGNEVWIKSVHQDGSWTLDRDTIDCGQDKYDTRQRLTYNPMGEVTDSYDEPNFQHNWMGIPPDTAGTAIEEFACYVPPK